MSLVFLALPQNMLINFFCGASLFPIRFLEVALHNIKTLISKMELLNSITSTILKEYTTMENPDSLENPKEIEVPSLTCEICVEPMTNNNLFNNDNRCCHPFCTDCVAKYIEAKLEQKVAEVPCPALNCEKLLDPLSCRLILPSELFEKWCDLLCEFEVLRCESAYCPFSDCSALILNECGDNTTRSKCPNCKKLVCFQCKLPWHAGFGCDETGDIRDENDTLFGELVERNKWKRCPGCKYHVERNEGCQNIKCRCGVLFCYGCGKVKVGCECNRRTGEVVRGSCGWIIKLVVYLMSAAFFIGLIVELYKTKGNSLAGIFGVIILFLYMRFLLPYCVLVS